MPFSLLLPLDNPRGYAILTCRSRVSNDVQDGSEVPRIPSGSRTKEVSMRRKRIALLTVLSFLFVTLVFAHGECKMGSELKLVDLSEHLRINHDVFLISNGAASAGTSVGIVRPLGEFSLSAVGGLVLAVPVAVGTMTVCGLLGCSDATAMSNGGWSLVASCPVGCALGAWASDRRIFHGNGTLWGALIGAAVGEGLGVPAFIASFDHSTTAQSLGAVAVLVLPAAGAVAGVNLFHARPNHASSGCRLELPTIAVRAGHQATGRPTAFCTDLRLLRLAL